MATTTFTGNLAADPEVVRIPSGREVTRLRIIENRRRLDRESGTWEDAEPNVYRVQAWGALGTNAAASLGQGMSVDVVGHVVTDRWPDKDTGQERTGQTVVADSLAPSLKWQRAQVTKAQKQSPAAATPPADDWQG
ncbi:single-stranded DNA-binding protein [Janibacter terrae]|uniref:single-stranded DNA-binding protein n=1 Tax=Janibacter terrae TaxID=103817 RepID=UPI0031F8A578